MSTVLDLALVKLFNNYLLYILSSVLLLPSCRQDNPQTQGGTTDESEPALEEFQKNDAYVAVTSAGSLEEVVADIEEEEDLLEPAIEQKEKLPLKKASPRPPNPKRKLGVIVFDSIEHHLEPMVEGDKVSRVFRFKNEGDGPLQIMTADVTCGCTTPTIPFIDIMPGEFGRIGVDYNSVNKEGHQEPEITITTNGTPKSITLKMIVDIISKEAAKMEAAKKDTLSN